MKLIKGILIPLAVITLCLSGYSIISKAEASYPNHHLLTDLDWLKEHIDDPQVRIIDMNPKDVYQQGHIRNAVHLDVEQILTSVEGIEWMMPSVKDLEETMGKLGINNETIVVIYNDKQGEKPIKGLNALKTRLFLTLEYLGHSKVNIINGGLPAWVAAGGQLTTEVISPPRTQYQAKVREDIVVGKEYVLAHLNDPNTILVDARGPANTFSGIEKTDTVLRGGHIPGAVHVPFHQNPDRKSGKWKSAEDLLKMYEKAGVNKDKEIIIYDECLWGGTLNYFTLRLLDYPKIKAYDGSWEEWANDAWAPIETSEFLLEWLEWEGS